MRSLWLVLHVMGAVFFGGCAAVPHDDDGRDDDSGDDDSVDDDATGDDDIGDDDTGDDDTSDVEYAIPAKEDWTERGVAFVAGDEGDWDLRLYGQISPSSAVKLDGTYLLYYVGADGDRSTDGGPRHRALGVATSADGITFARHPGNPILTHLPHVNEEEGIFSAGAIPMEDGTVALYYAAIWASDGTTESVQSYVAFATSDDGLVFSDQGYVLDWSDPGVWGYGDELFPLGALVEGGSWSVYYIAKGHDASWDLGLASGPGSTDLSSTTPLLTTHDIIGGCDPVPVGPDKVALFVVRSFDDNLIEVRTAPRADPGALSEPVQTYTTFEPHHRHTVVLLDRETETWFMYQATDREEDGNQVVVRTAPAVPAS